MPQKYDHKKIEKKWREHWEREKIWEVKEDTKAPKFYVLDMFPYPSAEGLHVGHPEGYTASDIVARYLRMKDKSVLHPMGFDSFGLPAENYAIKTGTRPASTTEKNIKKMRRQIKALGFSYDWSREVITSDPAYYKWTQWIFVQLFKKGLAYEADAPINWCPSCKTGLANEEVVNGKCERCGSMVGKKQIKQWLVKITDGRYIERLLNSLDKLDWPENIKLLQKNWIGRSEGAEVKFEILNPKYETSSKLKTQNSKLFIEVFTTRPDTLFGATYMVLSPEHPLVNQITAADQKAAVQKYIQQAQGKSDLERTDLAKEKTGVFTGAYAINPVDDKKIPIWVADYVLISYGTGAIMAVPAHDQRDFEFAKKFKLPIIEVVRGFARKDAGRPGVDYAWTGDGIAVNSGEFNGLKTAEFKKKITVWLEKNKVGKKAVNYKLRDWLFSRQRYWGEPIPIVHCEKCGHVAVSEKELPLKLPEVENYKPTGTGKSPLAAIEKWVNTKCPQCGGPAQRETNTMPQWAGSNWYFLRYLDPKNNKQLADPKKLKAWLPVDLYVGGAEHAVLHLLYARFIFKFLFDLKVDGKRVIPKECGDEPFLKLKNQGLIMGEDGQKMSKSRGNVINPDDVIKEYGADTLRMYEMFMGPFEDMKPWSTKSIIGVRRFLDRVYKAHANVVDKDLPKYGKRFLHTLIKFVTNDINKFKFNTCVSDLMGYSNSWSSEKQISREAYEVFLILLSPFAPHIAEELWQKLGHKKSIIYGQWPKYDEKMLIKDEIEYVVQVNGKLRDNIKAPAEASEEEVKKMALNRPKIKKYVTGEPKKVIFVKGRLINFVI